MDKNDSSAQSAVYNALRSNIMYLKLKPGTVISAKEIAEKLNVSRTPVREAFIRLQRDGLLDIYPQKETVVSKIDFSKVEQERFVRESLECANIDLLMGKCTKKDFLQLEQNIEMQRATVKNCDYNSLIKLDNDFHKYMFMITNQSLSWEIIENRSNNYARIRLVTIWDKDIMMATILQHQKILSSLQEGDKDFAKSYISSHMHNLETQKPQLIKDYPDYFVFDSQSVEDRFKELLGGL